MYWTLDGESSTAELHCASRADGKELWSHKYDWLGNAKFVKYWKGHAYFFPKTQLFGEKYAVAVHCIDPASGDVIWSYQPPEPFVSQFFSFHTITMDDTGLYFGSTNSYVYKLSHDKGEVIWQCASEGLQNTGKPDAVFSSVVLANGYVYTHASDNKVYCIDADKGTIRWTSGFPPPVMQDPGAKLNDPTETYFVPDPVAVGGGVMLASTNYAGQRAVHAFDLNTGEFKWEFRRNLLHYPTMFTHEGSGSLWVPSMSAGFERVSLSDGSLVNHYPISAQLGYVKGDTVLLDFSGTILMVRIKP
jgi:outer membrane protein assembly factor BamB